MQNELISPNLHVVLIHYPLAFLIIGTLIELFSFLWPRSSFRQAGRWMILIGALSAIPATFSGIYALRQVARVGGDAHWVDIRTTSTVLARPEIWNMLRRHTLYQSVATGIATGVVLIWLGSSDRLRKSLHLTLLMVLTATVGGIVYGSWFGGESIYRKGVAVEAVSPLPVEDAPRSTTMPASWTLAPTAVERMLPPLEMHMVMAGMAVSLAILSIGLSFRKITAGAEFADDPIITAGPISADRLTPRTPISNVDMVRTFNPDLEVELKRFAPAGRFWMLTFFIALLTLLGGLFVIARDADILEMIRQNPKDSWQLVWHQIEPGATKNYRSVAHAVTGATIVVLPVFLALMSRFAPRERIILTLATLLLMVAVAFQIWLGILLLLDTSDGPLNHFNTPALVNATT